MYYFLATLKSVFSLRFYFKDLKGKIIKKPEKTVGQIKMMVKCSLETIHDKR